LHFFTSLTSFTYRYSPKRLEQDILVVSHPNFLHFN